MIIRIRIICGRWGYKYKYRPKECVMIRPLLWMRKGKKDIIQIEVSIRKSSIEMQHWSPFQQPCIMAQKHMIARQLMPIFGFLHIFGVFVWFRACVIFTYPGPQKMKLFLKVESNEGKYLRHARWIQLAQWPSLISFSFYRAELRPLLLKELFSFFVPRFIPSSYRQNIRQREQKEILHITTTNVYCATWRYKNTPLLFFWNAHFFALLKISLKYIIIEKFHHLWLRCMNEGPFHQPGGSHLFSSK